MVSGGGADVSRRPPKAPLASAALLDFGTASKVGDEIHIEQTFGVSGGTPAMMRIRYFDIRPDSFSWSADRSDDAGRTWERAFQTIKARRIGPARSMEALAPARTTVR